MSKLALGSVQFGLKYGINNHSSKLDFYNADAIVRLAEREGIDVIDTAVSYGISENVLGKIGVSEFKVVTKLPLLPRTSDNLENWILNQVTNSIQRLGIKSLYALLFHNSKDLLNPRFKSLVRFLFQLKSENLIEKIGVSIYGPEELDRILDIFQPDIVQAPLNIIDRRLELSGWLSKLSKNKIEIHTRSTFLQGLLLTPLKNIPPKFNIWSDIWKKWNQEIEKNKLDKITECLSYPISHPEISRVIVGIDNLSQFKEIIKASKTNFKIKDWSFLSSIDQRLINPFNWKNL